MNIEAQKLEVVKMLLDMKSTEVLHNVKAILAANSSTQPKKNGYTNDTEYLLSTEANRELLMESIVQLSRG